MASFQGWSSGWCCNCKLLECLRPSLFRWRYETRMLERDVWIRLLFGSIVLSWWNCFWHDDWHWRHLIIKISGRRDWNHPTLVLHTHGLLEAAVWRSQLWSQPWIQIFHLTYGCQQRFANVHHISSGKLKAGFCVRGNWLNGWVNCTCSSKSMTRR